jgi:hypothetical protein
LLTERGAEDGIDNRLKHPFSEHNKGPDNPSMRGWCRRPNISGIDLTEPPEQLNSLWGCYEPVTSYRKGEARNVTLVVLTKLPGGTKIRNALREGVTHLFV